MKKRLHTSGMAQARVMFAIPELDAWATGDVTVQRKKFSVTAPAAASSNEQQAAHVTRPLVRGRLRIPECPCHPS
ncbi:hypothetical protein GCT19_29365 [Paraburkholderia sp. CNPSo 3155]|uniref:hypothetical protein n=1 Tax=Paraburkholderia atlantica TaxID=2654982 RepID=UPI00128BAE90|nr:hypothetical protein [Paraburkholderia atlantica]MPW09708.1 hypothetical protein [Paraburkholderia atlantica]